MKFVDEIKQGYEIRTVSKSKMDTYLKCPLRAYKDLREPRVHTSSRALDIGNLTHAIIEREVAKYLGQNVEEIEKIIEQYDLDVIYQVQNDILKRFNVEKLLENQTPLEAEENFSIPLEEVKPGFILSLKPDLLTYRDVDGQSFVQIYDWKTGMGMSTEVDSEAILYAYAVYKRFRLPVIFTRVGLRFGKIWSHEFSRDTLESMEPLIIRLVKKYVTDMESDIEPEHKPGSHCLYCPFIESCNAGKEYNDSLTDKFKTMVWAKELAKKLEKEIKEAAKEVLSRVGKPENDGEEVVLLPFTEGRYGAVAKTSVSWQLPRKIKKADVITLLEGAGKLPEVLDKLDLKIDEELATMLQQEFQVPVKPVARTSIRLVEQQSEED